MTSASSGVRRGHFKGGVRGKSPVRAQQSPLQSPCDGVRFSTHKGCLFPGLLPWAELPVSSHVPNTGQPSRRPLCNSATCTLCLPLLLNHQELSRPHPSIDCLNSFEFWPRTSWGKRKEKGLAGEAHHVHMRFISLGNQTKNNSKKCWIIAFNSTSFSRQEERKELAR